MQKQLFEDKVISRNEFNIAEAGYKSAEANYNAAKQGIRGNEAAVAGARANLAKANKDLGRTVIVAPMNGVVSLLSVKKGEKVAGNSFNVGTEMLRIADMSNIEIRVDVGENDIPKLHLGDSAVITVDAYNDRKFRGVVTQIASSNNGASAQSSLGNTSTDVTNYKVYIRILTESYADLLGRGKGTFPFRPGMSASADIQTRTHANVLSVPINAVTTRDPNEKAAGANKKDEKGKDEGMVKDEVREEATELDVVVYVINADNTVKKVKVKTAIQDINYIEITEGLKAGDMVVSGPYEVVSKTIKEKDRVKVVEKKDLFDKK
jgi:HlyD family secretion protein